MPKTWAVPNSDNAKLVGKPEKLNEQRKAQGKGPKAPRVIAMTARTADTCPQDCPFMGQGPHPDSMGVPLCYANDTLGRPSIMQMAEKYGQEDSEAELNKIASKTPKGSKVRHLVSGDVATLDASSPDDDYIKAANKLHAMRKDLEGFGYTHDWSRMAQNPARNWTLNASTETPPQAEDAIARGIKAAIESPADQSLDRTRIVRTTRRRLPQPNHERVSWGEQLQPLFRRNFYPTN